MRRLLLFPVLGVLLVGALGCDNKPKDTPIPKRPSRLVKPKEAGPPQFAPKQ